MPTLQSALNLARGALTAASGGVTVTSENITGTATPGYVRRSAGLEAYALGEGIAGGVRWRGTDRAFDGFAFKAMVKETSWLAGAERRGMALDRAEGAIAGPGDTTIGDRMADFFSALDGLATKADDPTARRQVIAAAESVAQGFEEASANLSALRDDLYQSARTAGDEVNDRLGRIAALNAKIASEPGATSAKAELVDQRDELVREVSERIDIATVFQADGTVLVASHGATLVEGNYAANLDVSLDANGDMQVRVMRGATAFDLTSKIAGGVIGGLREARDVDVAALQGGLDQLAYDFATAVNAQHTAGLDANGAAGLELFTDPGGGPLAPPPGTAYAFRVNGAIVSDANLLAAATPASPPPGGNANAIALSSLQSQPLAGGGTPAAQFANLAGDVGVRRSAAQSEQELRESTLAFAAARREEVSGVSLEEEMINLSKFQRAFDASSRVLSVVNEMMDTVLQLGR